MVLMSKDIDVVDAYLKRGGIFTYSQFVDTFGGYSRLSIQMSIYLKNKGLLKRQS